MKALKALIWILRSNNKQHLTGAVCFTSCFISKVIIRQNGLLYLSFCPNEVGFWNLELSNDGLGSPDFSVNIDATCTFSFLTDFRFLDLTLIHPHLRILPGYPTVGSLPGESQLQTKVKLYFSDCPVDGWRLAEPNLNTGRRFPR